ncbi:methyltransferase domain-containing protein [Candidatus Woesearchaeota archaeon]|nr:methyltransferase domain-containing protein [Candidatus Woesearchaeota archaeon]
MPTTDYADNAVVSEYAKLPPLNKFITYPALLTLLEPKEGMVILDAGCGPGHLTRAIAEQGARVIGVDRSIAMLSYALRHNHIPFRTQYHIGDISVMRTVGDSSIDATIMNMTTINIEEREKFYATFQQLERVLQPGAPLLFTDLASSFWESEVATQGRMLVDGQIYDIDLPLPGGKVLPVNDVFWSRATYADALSQAGLELENVVDLLPGSGTTAELGRFLTTPRQCLYAARKP